VTDEPRAIEPEAIDPDAIDPEAIEPGGHPRSSPRPTSAIPATAGLCARCVLARLVVSGRGSRFVLCERSRTDRHFPRYPPLPVMACVGFETAAAD
jgi:hypothetical protein